ncbi:hypothetical protein DICPUDRAFT_148209 [Dictyostelium purpureum]|uniref:Uncharacterized protein n=1 Tax=Dictyostelium purpureum TaxID=5786 RepID=F0ZAE3_DICPU|nr:uncharacterized protein DICPUDRAFT_148209 [Dictyostelium purpureum]EGC39057.1 hypothetical protein DICPUDRAFT_148209 [Dictyostelium purpureum]|eukprot:XP_003284407.1 hypothetical protein DICPUDRAFT_148209 [Dictyostelium purpureum]
MYKLIVFLIFVILAINNVNAFFNGKVFIMETYDSDDCSGEVKIHRALMYHNRNWTFQTVWDEHYRNMDCSATNPDLIKNNASCVWSNCFCDNDSCRTYFQVGQCIKEEKFGISNKLVYKKINYDERNYCTFNEGFYLVGDDVPLGLTIYKKNYCYKNIAYIECDLSHTGIRYCKDDEQIVKFSSGSIVVHNEECGYSELMFGSAGWWDNMLRDEPYFLKNKKSPRDIITILIII